LHDRANTYSDCEAILLPVMSLPMQYLTSEA
jgi:hypothetical protein